MKRISLLSFLILFSIGPALNTRAQDSAPAPTRLTLEVTFYPGRKPAYQTVPGPNAKPAGSWFGLFARTNPSQPAGASAVEAVRVVSRVEADGVRVIVSTLSGSKALENEQQVGTYLIHETEKIAIDELKRFGIEPFEIRLLRVNPTIAPVPPVVLKGVESLVVLNAMPKETTLPSFRIILRNQSNKNFVGFSRVLQNPFGVQIPPLSFTRRLYPSLDVGGVVEFYISPRWMARFDVGDTIIRYGEIRFPGLAPSFTVPSVTRHNLQTSSGIGFRF